MEDGAGGRRKGMGAAVDVAEGCGGGCGRGLRLAVVAAVAAVDCMFGTTWPLSAPHVGGVQQCWGLCTGRTPKEFSACVIQGSGAVPIGVC